jgi:hypothetical protein
MKKPKMTKPGLVLLATHDLDTIQTLLGIRADLYVGRTVEFNDYYTANAVLNQLKTIEPIFTRLEKSK